jgi:hypothetical protein
VSLYFRSFLMTFVDQKTISFLCEKCCFESGVRQSYERHVLTRKHLRNDSGQLKAHFCYCGKAYKYRQGLHAHKRSCKQNVHESIMTKHDAHNDVLLSILKSHEKTQETTLALVKSLQEQNSALLKQIVPAGCIQNNINSHNKTFNLQVFLNEDCKDAMNMSDFINSVTLQLSDLESVGELGYIEGISNIFLQKLNELDVYKRPIHCTDIKRHTMHIKDQDQWQRDIDHVQFKQAIKRMSKKNSDLLMEWKHQRSFLQHDRDQDKYMSLIIQCMGGGSDVSIDDSEVKIIKRIAKGIVLDRTT